MATAKQVLPKVLLRGSSIRALSVAVRQFSSNAAKRKWKNETPTGGLTEIYVYQPESQTIWPDPALGLFSQHDPRFGLPGNIGLANTIGQPHASTSSSDAQPSQHIESDIFTKPTNKENQAQTLYTANDYIQHTSGAEDYVCHNVLENYPKMNGLDNLVLELHDAPVLLRKEIKDLFPQRNMEQGHLSVITISQKTDHDMSTWSQKMEDEREKLTSEFVMAAKEIVGKLKEDGYWSDFIDPSSGMPYYDPYANTTLFETNEQYRLLGFRIEDLGCCKVICHHQFGRNVFVGTIFTDAHASTGIIQDVFKELNLELNNPSSGLTSDSNTSAVNMGLF